MFLLHNLGQFHFISHTFIVEFNFCSSANCMQYGFI